jgi:hypothetical protein
MFKSFNWGQGITVFYIVFVGVVVTALVASFSVDHTLVVDDYYAKDIAYQSQYEKIQNDINSDKVIIKQDQDNIIINFPDVNAISGTIQFYRASDKSKDFTHQITSVSEVISIKGKAAGKWKMKIDWMEGNKAFYKEEVIIL